MRSTQARLRARRKLARAISSDDTSRAGSSRNHNRRRATLSSVGDPEISGRLGAGSVARLQDLDGTLPLGNTNGSLGPNRVPNLGQLNGMLPVSSLNGRLVRDQLGNGIVNDDKITNVSWSKLLHRPKKFNSSWKKVSGKPSRFKPVKHNNQDHSVNFARANHSHSTSYALRFEALPEEERDYAIEQRRILSEAVVTPPPGSSPVQHATRYWLALLAHVSLDGLTESLEERRERRRANPPYEQFLRRKTFEMLGAEIREGTTVEEEGVTPLHPDDPLAPRPQITPATRLPRFVRPDSVRPEIKRKAG